MIFWAALIGLGALACAIEAARRIFLLIFRDGFKKIFGIICLTFELTANILRIIFCIDPLRSFRILSYAFSGFLLLAPHFFSVVPTVLLAFYLHDVVISSKVQVPDFLAKLKIPFIIALALVTIISIVSLICTLVNVYASVTAPLIEVAVFAVNIALAIYFTIVCYKIYHVTKSLHLKSLKQVVFRICVAVVGVIFQTILALEVAFVQLAEPLTYKLVFLFVMIFSLMISIAQITAFIPGKHKLKSGSSASKKKSSDSSATASVASS